ncbi:MAG: alanine racemase [Boseongicola sp. SB0675_bin_26]|nr:alanine racemase [Boseongicola sp. SB0675_bin_26]
MGAARLTIDLDAICANWRALDALSDNEVETAAVVKADAYGIGAARVAKALAEAGARSYFVALAEEGVAVRDVLGNLPDIYVFAGHMEGESDTLVSARLIPLLNAPDQMSRHAANAPAHPFGVQIDTGMNRLGFEPSEWSDCKGEILESGPLLVMSHLACADEPDHPMNARQLDAFRGMTDGISRRRSLAATGGILLGPEYHFDLTRPGVGLYGGQPFCEARPAIRLDVPVIQTRTVQPGETVGYGNAWTAAVPTKVATISAGYADGLLRAAAPGAVVFAGHTPCPVVGRISMDLVTVDVSGLHKVPASLQVIGPNASVDDFAEAADTIGYEILTSLGTRYERVYLPQ